LPILADLIDAEVPPFLGECRLSAAHILNAAFIDYHISHPNELFHPGCFAGRENTPAIL